MILRSASLGSLGPLFGEATQGSQREGCLGGWRCKGPCDEFDRRRLGGTASKLISRMLSRMDGIRWLLRGTWACGTGGSRGERKHLITPAAPARGWWISTVVTCPILFCSICFLPAIYCRCVRPVWGLLLFGFRQRAPRNAFPCVCIPHSII